MSALSLSDELSEAYITDEKAISDYLSNGFDFNNIRTVLKSRPINAAIRPKIWQILLGVAHRSDPFSDASELFDLPEQEAIRNTCSKIFEKLGNCEEERLAIISDLESVLTLFCKSRDVKFDLGNGWSDVLQLLCTLKLQKAALYNVFHAIVTKYIPVGCIANGKPFDLFRLLLLYHDPVLCSVLDTGQLTPDLYGVHWFNSLFAATCDLDVALRIWDVYLQRADPFLIFFMALVTLINARDQILENKDKPKEETAKFIKSLLYNLEADDIEDFCQLASHYSSKTPQSFRRDYHGPLFGTNLTQAFENVTIHSLLCLPVSVQELLISSKRPSPNYKNSNESYINYFLIDCRPSQQYQCGHLPSALNLDASVIVNEPSKFHEMVARLEELKQKSFPDSHWCLLGSGADEEDRFVFMLISFLLQKGVNYVSLVRGGFRAVHDSLKENLSSRLKAHNVKGCVACIENAEMVRRQMKMDEMTITNKKPDNLNGSPLSGSLSQKSISLFNKVKEAVKTKSTEVKGLVSDYIQNNEASTSFSPTRHVDSTDRHSKKAYRNTASVFTVSEEGSSDDMSGEELPASEMDVLSREKVNVKNWLESKDTVVHFDCQEIDDDRKAHDSFLVLTKSHVIVLRDCYAYSKADKGLAFVKSKRHVSSILKITSKRHCPELLTFKYGFELVPGQGKVTCSERFYVPKAGDCAKAVKLAIVNWLQAHE